MTAMFLKLKLKTKSVPMKIFYPYIFFQNLFSLSHHIAIYIYINAAAIFPYAAGIRVNLINNITLLTPLMFIEIVYFKKLKSRTGIL